MPLWAIIPVKRLAESKSRLATVLTPAERARLVQRLLEHELETLRQVAAIERTVVVSSDETILSLAAAFGATLIEESHSQGINVAVQKAVKLAEQAHITAVLILPVDLPFLHSDDIKQIIDAAMQQPGQKKMVICPDGHGTGTNALFLPPLLTFAFQYGEQSFQKHLVQAKQHQLAPNILRLPRLMFDLDTIDDWFLYQQTLAAKHQSAD